MRVLAVASDPQVPRPLRSGLSVLDHEVRGADGATALDILQRYREDHRIEAVWEARERVVVALPGGDAGDLLIRRTARIASRSSRAEGAGAELLAVHIEGSDGLAAGTSSTALAAQRHLVESLGGSYHSIVGDDVPRALLEFARAQNATQLVLGTSRRGRLARFLTGRGIGETTIRLSGDIDVPRSGGAARRLRDRGAARAVPRDLRDGLGRFARWWSRCPR